MAPPRPLFDLNEPPPEPEEDIEDDAATACESSQSQQPPLEVNGGRGDGSTARGLPSPPAPEDGNTGDALPEGELGDALPEDELLFPVLDLDASLSPLDDEDEEEDDDLPLDDLPRPPDDPDGGRSPGPSCSSERMASDRSTASHTEAAALTTPCSHADDGVDTHGTGPVHASRHGGGTSPRRSLPDCHDTKALSPAFSVRSSSENNSASHVDGMGDTGTASPSHMPRRHKPPSVPRDDYYSTSRDRDDYVEESGTSHGASRRAGSPSTLHRERSTRSHPYAMHGGQGTPRMNQRRRRPKRQGYNGDDQRQQVYNNGHDQRQRVYDVHGQRQQVNNYHDQRQVYNNYQDQRQQVYNGRDQRQKVYNNGHDQRQQVYNNGHDQRQRVYDVHDQRQQVNNYHDQRQKVYNNYQDQRQQVYNGRDQRQKVYNTGHDQRQQVYDVHDQRQQVNNYHDQRQKVYNNYQDQRQQVYNGRDQRQKVYNTGHDQRQQVYNNSQDQRRQGHHGHRRSDGYQDRQGQLHHGYSAPNRQGQLQGYYSGSPFAGQYAGEDSYGGGRQIPAKQQPSNGGGYQQHRETPRGQQRHFKPYHPYAQDADASGDRTNAGKQAKHQPQVYQQHQRNTQSTAGALFVAVNITATCITEPSPAQLV